MPRRLTTTIALFVLVLATGVGVLDSALEQADDHLVLFAAALVVAVALTLTSLVSNPTVAVRRDVLRWATRRSQLTGEPVDRIVNRALDGYRFLLEPTDDGNASSKGDTPSPVGSTAATGTGR